jgi:dolichyl-phosphate-mannose--protein O-mannosyl transferase
MFLMEVANVILKLLNFLINETYQSYNFHYLVALTFSLLMSSIFFKNNTISGLIFSNKICHLRHE